MLAKHSTSLHNLYPRQHGQQLARHHREQHQHQLRLWWRVTCVLQPTKQAAHLGLPEVNPHTLQACCPARKPQQRQHTQGIQQIWRIASSAPAQAQLFELRPSGQLSSRTQPLHAVAPAQSWFGKIKASVEELVGIAPPVSDPTLPTHWEQQLVKLTVGKRRALERYFAEVKRISALEPAMKALSDAQLQAKTGEFRGRLAAGQSLDDMRIEAFAVVREASFRVLGMRHYDCQLVGGLILHEGQIAEMSTGEGKTLVATLPVYLNALTGLGVHVATVNDYLAKRDSEWMGKLYRFLGMSCDAVQSGMEGRLVQAAFKCDVTYVTGQELCFSYLKDNGAIESSALVLPAQLNFAVVDEVDCILIDESRNPMIISVAAVNSSDLAITIDKVVKRMWATIQAAIAEVNDFYADHASIEQPPTDQGDQEREERVKRNYYIVDQKQRTLSLTELGTEVLLAELVHVCKEQGTPLPADDCRDVMLWEGATPYARLAVIALQAYEFYVKDRDYLMRDDQVVIIDQNTGRLKASMRWMGGIHRAIEAKENVSVKQDTKIGASITFQLFFKMYRKVAGMTGTAQAAAGELFDLYGLKVVGVPTNKPSAREDLPSMVFFDRDGRLRYIADIVNREAWVMKRPVLIGTASVAESQLICGMLEYAWWPQPEPTVPTRHDPTFDPTRPNPTRDSLKVCVTSRDKLKPELKGQAQIQLLNANPALVRAESLIIAQAGLPESVTISTNMAGRGTDIILGGNAEGLAQLALMRLVLKRLLPSSVETDSGFPPIPLHTIFDKFDQPQVFSGADDLAELKANGGKLPRTLGISIIAAQHMASLAMQVSAPAPLNPSTNTAATAKDIASSPQDVSKGAAAGSGSGSSPGPALEPGSKPAPDPAAAAPPNPSSGTPPPVPTGPGSAGSTPVFGFAGSAPVPGSALGMVSVSKTPVPPPKPPNPLGLTYKEITAMASQLMDEAGKRRKEVMAEVRLLYPNDSLLDLDFELDLVPIMNRVHQRLDVLPENADEPAGRRMSMKVALQLWIFFDRDCAEKEKQVQMAGGLLVIGTSVNESRRVEQQLRGRAGRQGDRGSSVMMYDAMDSKIATYGGTEIYKMTMQLVNNSAFQARYGCIVQDEILVRDILTMVVRGIEGQAMAQRFEAAADCSIGNTCAVEESASGNPSTNAADQEKCTAATRPPRRIEFQPDDEQQQRDAEFGHADLGFGIADQMQHLRPDDRARDEIAERRAEAETAEDQNENERKATEDDAIEQQRFVHAGAFAAAAAAASAAASKASRIDACRALCGSAGVNNSKPGQSGNGPCPASHAASASRAAAISAADLRITAAPISDDEA
ncbi:MAG: hypothetical protein WDW38_003755 [Sanguina aurantia]